MDNCQEGRKGAAEAGELHFRCKEYVEKVESYQVRSNRKFFDVELLAAEIEKLKAENQRLRDEITKLKGITKPGKKYFYNDGFTLAVDLAIAEAIIPPRTSRATRCRPSS
eukprot:3325324-Pleurochrysis_carterae.AAC.1